MSATAKSIFNWFCKQGYVKESRRYTLGSDYNYVNQVIFYERKELTSIIDNIISTDDDKIVVFINSADKMLELYSEYKDIAHFYCSENAKKLKKIREADCIKVHSENCITFEKRILFTTIALDNGIDLKDEKIKYIISEIFEPDNAIQCLGRKRPINENDKCIFYIAEYGNADITRFNNSNNTTMKPLTLFNKHKEDFISQYGKKREWHSRYIYNDWDNSGNPRLNLVGYYKLGILKVDIMGMLNHGYFNSMCEYSMSKELAEKVIAIKAERKTNNKELEDYLHYIVGQELLDSAIQNLKDIFKNAGFNSSTYGVITMNRFLCANKYSYSIMSGKRKRYEGIQKTPWIVNKL